MERVRALDSIAMDQLNDLEEGSEAYNFVTDVHELLDYIDSEIVDELYEGKAAQKKSPEKQRQQIPSNTQFVSKKIANQYAKELVEA